MRPSTMALSTTAPTQPGFRRYFVGLAAGLALVSLVLSGCGFQLRGATAIPDALAPIHVDCAGKTPVALCDQVLELLELNQVALEAEPGPDTYVLRLAGLERSQRATAITASAAAAEYALRLTATLSLLAPGPVPLLADAETTASEVFRYDEANVLAKRREQQELIELLYGRLAQQIVFRLRPFTAERISSIVDDYQQQSEQAQPPEPSPEVPAN